MSIIPFCIFGLEKANIASPIKLSLARFIDFEQDVYRDVTSQHRYLLPATETVFLQYSTPTEFDAPVLDNIVALQLLLAR